MSNKRHNLLKINFLRVNVPNKPVPNGTKRGIL